MRKIKLGMIGIGMVCLPSLLISAEQVYLENLKKDAIPVSSKDSFLKNPKKLNKVLGFSDEVTLHKRKEYTSPNGKVTVRYTQRYKNIPIIGSEIILAKKPNKNVQSAYGSGLYGIAKDIQEINPQLSSQDAIAKAKEDFLAKYVEAAKKSSFSDEKSSLKIWKNKENVAVLIYEVSFWYESNTPKRPHYYIDAMNGSVLYYFDGLMHAHATGPGGNEKTGKYQYGSNGLGFLEVTQNGTQCIMDTQHVTTINLNHGTSGSTPYQFTCPTNTYKVINGAYSPLNDAHYFGIKVFEMYRKWLNVSPLTGKLKLGVHYRTNYQNAHWDSGTSMMYFGDGASILYPLVSMDLIGHEVSHGFTQQNSNLVYAGKSGGLNESFSDIAGEALEYYITGTNDWYSGGTIFKNGSGLRSLQDPTSIPPSIDNQDDYNNGLDVHYSSGVYNKAFYLLATTSGWNTRKAFEVYAKANQEYWTSTTDWDQAGNGVVHAASDLGYNTAAVCSSLTQVGVKASACSITPSTPNAPSNLKATAQTTTATLIWKDNANNEKGFKIYNGAQLVATLGANVKSYGIKNLIAGTSYTYSVSAYNNQGESAKVSTTFTTQAAVFQKAHITAPQDGSTLTDTSMTVTWEKNSAKRMYLYVYQSSPYKRLSAGYVSGTSKVITGIPSNGKKVSIVLYSLNNSNRWVTEVISVTAKQNTETIPNTPSNLKATAQTTTATLRWSDNADNEQGFKIYKGTQLVATLGANVRSYGITNLIAERSYTYHVSAYNNQGESAKVSTTFTTQAAVFQKAHITAPQNRSTLTGSSMTVTWEKNSAKRVYLFVYQTSPYKRLFSGYVSGTSKVITGIPSNGKKVSIVLYSLNNSNRWVTETRRVTESTTGN